MHATPTSGEGGDMHATPTSGEGGDMHATPTCEEGAGTCMPLPPVGRGSILCLIISMFAGTEYTHALLPAAEECDGGCN